MQNPFVHRFHSNLWCFQIRGLLIPLTLKHLRSLPKTSVSVKKQQWNRIKFKQTSERWGSPWSEFSLSSLSDSHDGVHDTIGRPCSADLKDHDLLTHLLSDRLTDSLSASSEGGCWWEVTAQQSLSQLHTSSHALHASHLFPPSTSLPTFQALLCYFLVVAGFSLFFSPPFKGAHQQPHIWSEQDFTDSLGVLKKWRCVIVCVRGSDWQGGGGASGAKKENPPTGNQHSTPHGLLRKKLPQSALAWESGWAPAQPEAPQRVVSLDRLHEKLTKLNSHIWSKTLVGELFLLFKQNVQ